MYVLSNAIVTAKKSLSHFVAVRGIVSQEFYIDLYVLEISFCM